MATTQHAPAIASPEPPLHPLAKRCEAEVILGAPDDRGILVPRDRNALFPLRVTADALPRAVDFLSTLFYALEARGAALSREKDSSRMLVLVETEEIEISLNENVRLKPRYLIRAKDGKQPRPRQLEYQTRGKLVLRMTSTGHYPPMVRRCEIENGLDVVLDEFSQLVQALRIERKEQARKREEWKRQGELKGQARERARENVLRSKVIKKAAQSLETSQRIRWLVTCLGKSPNMNELNHDLLPRFKQMLGWCTEYANSLDPTNQLAVLVEEFSNPTKVSFGTDFYKAWNWWQEPGRDFLEQLEAARDGNP